VTEVTEVTAVSTTAQATSCDGSRSKPHPMRTAARICAFPLVAAGLAAAGCTASAEDVRPPPDQLSFPTGMAASPDGSALFVANANSELRYDSGSIGVIDLNVVRGVIDGWVGASAIPANCTPDLDHGETLVCDEAQFFRRDAAVRVGNFATDLTIQDFSAGGTTKLRVIVPTRGDPSIAWADYDGNRLSCTAGTDTFALCDDAHRLSSLDNDPNQAALLGEPFSVFADAVRGFAMVSHLATGAITLINAPADSGQVAIVDTQGVFTPTLSNGGASTIAGRTPGSKDGDLIYAGASSENRIQSFTVTNLDGAAAYLVPGAYFFLDSVGASAGNSTDTRAIRFSASGDRLYVVNRAPPSLQVFDTSLSPTGVPRNLLQGASDICREASSLALLDPGSDAHPVGERVYVTCFQDGQIYIVDPTGLSHVEDIVTVGRQPYAAVAVATDPAHKQLFVSNFLEDTIAVIDLSIDSPKRNRVVLRIGIPRAR